MRVPRIYYSFLEMVAAGTAGAAYEAHFNGGVTPVTWLVGFCKGVGLLAAAKTLTRIDLPVPGPRIQLTALELALAGTAGGLYQSYPSGNPNQFLNGSLTSVGGLAAIKAFSGHTVPHADADTDPENRQAYRMR